MMVEWYVYSSDKWYGPFSSSKLKQLAQVGRISPNNRVKIGMEGDTYLAGSVEGLFDHLKKSKSNITTVRSSPDEGSCSTDRRGDVGEHTANSSFSIMKHYWVKSGQRIIGPLTASQIRSLYAKGKIGPQHQISIDQKQWIFAHKVSNLTLNVPIHTATEISYVRPNKEPEGVVSAAQSNDDEAVHGRSESNFDPANLESLTKEQLTDIYLAIGQGKTYKAIKLYRDVTGTIYEDALQAVNSISISASDEIATIQDESMERFSAYSPSGLCSYPVRLLLFFPLVIIAAVLGAAIGAVLGAIIGGMFGFAFAGITGYVLDVFGASVRGTAISAGLWVGSWIGAGTGIIIANMVTGYFALESAHNRNTRIALGYGAAIGLSLITFYVTVWFTIPEMEQAGNWRLLGLVVIAVSGLITTFMLKDNIQTTPYCETCNSYLKNPMICLFSESIDYIRKHAALGNMENLLNLTKVPDKIANTMISLSICREGCIGKLELARAVMVKQERPETIADDIPVLAQIKSGIREQAKKQGAEWAQDKYEKRYQIVVSGIVDAANLTKWKKVLSTEHIPLTA